MSDEDEKQKTWWGIHEIKDGGKCNPCGVLPSEEIARNAAEELFPEGNWIVEPVNPDHLQQWGPGKLEDKPFDKVRVAERPDVEGVEAELYFGEHPHSRGDNNQYANYGDGRVVAFNGHRLLHEIVFRDYNYTKESYVSGDEIRKGGSCQIKINGLVCHEFFYRDVERALHQAAGLLSQIHEHSSRVWDPEDRARLEGRKIYYYNTPAVITRFIADQASVIIEPEKGHKFPLRPWQQEDLKEGQPVDDENTDSVKDEILSPHIWWWRT